MNKTKTGFAADLKKHAIANDNFRQVLFTGDNSQLVLMSLEVGEDIGMEVHDDIDQFVYILQGQALVTIGDEKVELEAGGGAVVPAGENHNVENTGEDQLKIFTMYSPAEHPDGTVHATKQEAEADHHDH